MLSIEKRIRTSGQVLKWVQIIFFGSLILYFARSILIPISFSILISFVVYPVCRWLEGKGIGRFGSIALTLFVLMILLSLLVTLLVYQLIGFVNEWPSLHAKITASLSSFSDFLTTVGISRQQQDDFISSISTDSGKDFLNFVGETIRASISSTVMLVLIPVYAILILYYRSHWLRVLHRIFPNETKGGLNALITLTIQAYYNFIKGMALVYLIVGILNSLGLLALGIPHAILFGFIASVLTFIPYVGIIIGSLLPIAVSWVTYDSVWYPVAVIAVFSVVQYLEANVIFPFAVSNRLNVNTFVMLIAIFAGGLIWGLAGMILFVPFVGIAKLIADHHPAWKTASMILGMDAPARKRRRR